MIGTARRPGATLLELVFVVTVLALLVGAAAPPLRSAAERAAARNARDAVASAVGRTRALAVARGGATLVVDVERARFWIEAPPGSPAEPSVDLAARFNARVSAEAAPVGEPIVLEFDSRGLGRMTNRTFHFHRGSARASLTLSAYGRPRRW